MQYAQKETIWEEERMPRYKPKKRYKAKTYKTFTVNAKIADYEKIELYCNTNNISKAGLLLKAALYCIDNEIKL